MKKIFLPLFTSLIIFSYFTILPVFASESNYMWSNKNEIKIEDELNNSNNITEQKEKSFSSISTNNQNLKIESGSAILLEQTTGQILYEHNSHEKLRPASVTKIMSILLIMEALENGIININDNVTCSSNARSMGGSQIWLNEKEKLTVDEMLKAICIVSANDCTVAMAEHLCGSQEAFVQKMNEKAKNLGMNDTCFKNCHGIDEDGHLTSAYDISLMSRELLTKYPSILNYTTVWMDSLRNGKSQLVNTNKLLRNYQGCTGLKTGSTSLALYNLSASATRNGLSLISVIMKAPTTEIRFSEAKLLLDYGFNNFSSKSLAKSNDIVKTVNISKGIENSVNGVFSKDVSIIISNDQKNNISQKISIPDQLNAPIEKGQKIGEVVFSNNDTIFCTVDIIADSEIKKLSFFNISNSLYKYWFSLTRNK